MKYSRERGLALVKQKPRNGKVFFPVQGLWMFCVSASCEAGSLGVRLMHFQLRYVDVHS